MEPSAALKILILDDNALDREMCRRYLGRRKDVQYDFSERNAIDGAIDHVKDWHPDCILLDYHLQDGTGMEFIAQLAELGGPKRHPVVMLTGTGNETIAVQVMKAGAQDYLVKDRLSADILQRTVENAIYKAQTERLLDEQRAEMERLFREAQEANARKDQFLAALSHELRTPLTPVLAAVNSMELVGGVPPQWREVFDIIRRNVKLEARLIDDLLDLTRISRGKLDVSPRPEDVHALLRHAAEACVEDRAARDVSIEWHLHATPAVAPVDPARMQQVFWNLLKNAIKFSPTGGAVCVSTHAADDVLVIEVADAGIGLQPDTEERIFEAFEQGGSEITRRFGGLGLGLAISKALVEAHGGQIRAANRGGRSGAIFTVTLPLAAGGATPDAASVAPRESHSPATADALVLLVEDHADSAYFLKRMLEAFGYRVQTAGNIAEALGVFQSTRVDYIVSDLGLPDGSGTELMEQIRAIRPVPGIALSGYGMESDVQRSLAAGFSRHLTKPAEVTHLAEALKSLAEETRGT